MSTHMIYFDAKIIKISKIIISVIILSVSRNFMSKSSGSESLCILNFHTFTVTTLWANSADDKLMIFFFFFFFQKIGFDTSCKLSPKETICMKCQSYFLGKKIFQNVVG